MIRKFLNSGVPDFRKCVFLVVSIIVVGLNSCSMDPVVTNSTDVETSCATPLELTLPDFFPPMPATPGNLLTVEGVELGRRLFYDPILSGDNTQSCASCHQQGASFVDANKRLSVGIDGFPGFRNSMPLYNLAWADKYFWDGNARSLEELVLIPIEAEFEMHENLFSAVKELQEHPDYPNLFYQAFCDSTVNAENMAKAMAQFLRTIFATSLKLAPGSVGTQSRSPQEERGYRVFLDETKGDCFHCHVVNAFNSNFEFMNNGLNPDPTKDPGLFGQTANPNDMGKFKVPSLLNIDLTAPYMHDGRFASLEEVLAFYDTGFHYSSTLDPNLVKHMDASRKPIPRKWSAQDKADLLVFIRSLKDNQILTNKAYSAP